MRAFALAGCVLLALGASGCRKEQRSPARYPEVMNRSSVSSADTVTVLPAPVVPNPRDTAAVTPGAPGRAAVALRPRTRVPFAGVAALEGTPLATEIAVRLRTGMPVGTLTGSVRRGQCMHPGPQVASMNAVSVDSAGAGASSTRVAIPLDTLRARPHAIVFGRGGAAELCGEVR